MNYILGIDAGGTFIDYLLVNDTGKYLSHKTLARPDVSDYGIISGLEELAEYTGYDLPELLARVRLIVHGTTVATNAILTRSGSPTALLTTEGLVDLLEMRQGFRDNLYDNHRDAPVPLVERWLRYPVKERLNYKGQVLKPLDEDFACQQLQLLSETEVQSVAIVLAHSYINPHHEQLLAQLVRCYLPHVHISLSYQVLPRVHMYRRVSTTVLNAYIAPILESYLKGLLDKLRLSGFQGDLLIMQSNGGTVSVIDAMQLPVMSLLSGPAAGPVMVKCLGEEIKTGNAIIMDMGGTSFDVSLLRGGEPGMTENSSINGYFVGLPAVDIHTIGAGGGSIARVDSGGLLHVGPESAGARPGPACYGQGGNHATCTDADLVLGLINPNYFLGGRLKLNLEAAWDVIYKEVALPLQTNVLSAALGIYRMVNTEMASGIKEITLEKGYDPREMTMVVGGGAGALHAPYVAKELGIRHLLISRESSVMCALGMLYSNYRRDYYRHYYSQVFAFNWQVVQEIYHQLWLHAREQAGDRNNLLIAHKLIYMRYQGQHHELAVEISKLECLDSTELARLFHNHHFNIYGYDLSDLNTPIEIIGLAIVVEDEAYNIPPYKPGSANSGRPTLKGTRRVCLEEPGSYQEIPVYDGDNMPFNSRITGPALVEQRHSTTVVPADFTLLCTGNYFEMKQI